MNNITFQIKYKHALLIATIFILIMGLLFDSKLVIFISGMLACDALKEFNDHLFDFISEKKIRKKF